MGMHPKGSQETRKLGKLRAGIYETQEQVSHYRKLESVVYVFTDSFPDMPSAEQCLLRSVTNQGSLSLSCGGKHSPADLQVILIIKHTEAIHNIHAGVGSRKHDDVIQRPRG